MEVYVLKVDGWLDGNPERTGRSREERRGTIDVRMQAERTAKASQEEHKKAK